VKKVLVALAVLGVFSIETPLLAQQKETGPAAASKKDAHPVKGPETGTRGPSGTSPETGYHGPRDVTTDQEPGKAKTAEEMKKSGTSPSTKN
jgi:hypothetical protein